MWKFLPSEAWLVIFAAGKNCKRLTYGGQSSRIWAYAIFISRPRERTFIILDCILSGSWINISINHSTVQWVCLHTTSSPSNSFLVWNAHPVRPQSTLPTHYHALNVLTHNWVQSLFIEYNRLANPEKIKDLRVCVLSSQFNPRLVCFSIAIYLINSFYSIPPVSSIK
jgi:hypothetical protein